MQNLESWRAFKVRDILRSDKDKLTVAHFFSNFDECVNDSFSSDRIKKDIEFIHHSEGSFQHFTNGQ